MKAPSFRTALASSVMALLIAFYPGTAIVNADTPTEPTAASQTTQAAPAPAPQPTQPQTAPTATDAPTTTPPPAPPTTPPTNTPTTTATQQSPTPTQQSAPATTTVAPTSPAPDTSAQQRANPGSGYTYNAGTGLWENGQYTWDPNTHLTTPKNAESYSYNPSTGAWDTTDWRYDTASGKYVPNTPSPTTPTPQSSPTPNTLSTPAPSATPNNSPAPNPANTFNTFYDASISGVIDSTSKSGDANVTQNTRAGNVESGDALAITNLFNLFQSSANFLNPDNQLKTFNANIQGDVVGDLLLDPGQINSLATTNGATKVGSLTVNNQANAAINAKVNLDAQSGNATTASNTVVGNTTTGNADAIANVVNMINSTIGAGQSFMGAINIYGNLDGDILLPPGFLDTLLASNAPSANPSTQGPNSSTLASLTNNQSINNAINAKAQSGTATVTDNTLAGDAKTGDAITNLTVLNLSSSNVIGANNLLVFVNVLGKWYGVIMDAPVGTTAASLGGGITQNESLTQAQDTTTRSTANSAINNDINVRARSGDAMVTKNTKAGNATTGNATASVNLANFIGNHLSLSDWFGILFINVFGTWKGSFGIDTIAGGHSTSPAPSGNQQPSRAPAQAHVFKFVPNSGGSGNSSQNGNAPYHLEPAFMGDTKVSPSSPVQDDTPAVLASSVASGNAPHTIFKSQPSEKKQMASWIMPVAGLTLGSLLLIGERIMARREKE